MALNISFHFLFHYATQSLNPKPYIIPYNPPLAVLPLQPPPREWSHRRLHKESLPGKGLKNNLLVLNSNHRNNSSNKLIIQIVILIVMLILLVIVITIVIVIT